MEKIVTIDGGSRQYWTELREGHRLVRLLERRFEDLASAQFYPAGPGNIADEEEGYEPVDYTRLWALLAEAQDMVSQNSFACRILKARGWYDGLMDYRL